MVAAALTGLLAAIHLYILWLEMVLWTSPQGRKAFGMTEDFAKATRVMAANQGLYNGFLAAGLIWSLYLGLGGEGRVWALFFLTCVLVAGLFGALTVSRRILFVQALPAALALLALWVGL